MLIADTGAIYAFYDGDDQYHKLAREIINANAGKIIVPDLILVEIDYLLGHLLNVQAELDFLQCDPLFCLLLCFLLPYIYLFHYVRVPSLRIMIRFRPTRRLRTWQSVKKPILIHLFSQNTNLVSNPASQTTYG